MKLPEGAVISNEKIIRYLLAAKKRNDKSKWLSKAGYTLDNWNILKADIKALSHSNEAVPQEHNDYGQMFKVKGSLKGPNGRLLSVCTVWITEYYTGVTKFITMYPDKKERP